MKSKISCCQRSLMRPEADYCAECGARIRNRSRAAKEGLLFTIANQFRDPEEAIQFIEDMDQYGDAALYRWGMKRNTDDIGHR